MSYLKKQNVNACMTLLREYINNTPSSQSKGTAILALNQLKQITAGTNTEEGVPPTVEDLNCNGRPRVNGDAL